MPSSSLLYSQATTDLLQSSFFLMSATMKANSSVEYLNFSNRFNMANMDSNISTDALTQLEYQGPHGPKQEFTCGSSACPANVIDALDLTPPTGTTSKLPSFEIGFIVVFIIGILFTAACIAVFIFIRRGRIRNGKEAWNWNWNWNWNDGRTFRIQGFKEWWNKLARWDRIGNRKRETQGSVKWWNKLNRRNRMANVSGNETSNGNFKTQGSIKWWNKIARPTFGTSELSAGPGTYETAELPGEDEPVFELPAGSIRRSHGRRVASDIGNSEDSVGLGIRTPSTRSSANSAAKDNANEAESSDESPARETTTLLRSSSMYPSPKPPITTNLRKSISSPSPRLAPEIPIVTVSSPPPPPKPPANQVPLSGFFAPSETEMRVLAGVEAPLPPPKPKAKEMWVYK
jgi:hypothetical protein